MFVVGFRSHFIGFFLLERGDKRAYWPFVIFFFLSFESYSCVKFCVTMFPSSLYPHFLITNRCVISIQDDESFQYVERDEQNISMNHSNLIEIFNFFLFRVSLTNQKCRLFLFPYLIFFDKSKIKWRMKFFFISVRTIYGNVAKEEKIGKARQREREVSARGNCSPKMYFLYFWSPSCPLCKWRTHRITKIKTLHFNQPIQFRFSLFFIFSILSIETNCRYILLYT